MRQIPLLPWYLLVNEPLNINEPEPMEKKLVETLKLPNTLTLELYDCSKRLAGDRWYVALLARVPIKITEEDFLDRPEGKSLYAEFVEGNGHEIYFELKKERNFIDEREKDAVFEELLSNLKKHVLGYFGHEAFAKGVIRRHIEKFEQERTWWK